MDKADRRRWKQMVQQQNRTPPKPTSLPDDAQDIILSPGILDCQQRLADLWVEWLIRR